PEARRSDVEVRLSQEQVVHGRLVDLQGQPAPGARIQVTVIAGQFPGKKQNRIQLGGSMIIEQLYANYPDPQNPPSWPEPVTTDAQGRFSLHGLARDWSVTVKVQHDRFAPQYLEIKAQEWANGESITRALAPARFLEGEVTYAD